MEIMGFITSISPLSLVLILLIIILLFGTKRLKTLGKDLGEAISGFQKGMKNEDTTEENENKVDTVEKDIEKDNKVNTVEKSNDKKEQ